MAPTDSGQRAFGPERDSGIELPDRGRKPGLHTPQRESSGCSGHQDPPSWRCTRQMD